MPRASGKTTLLIKESAKTGRPIIEPNTFSAKYVEEQAKEMGLNIPEPISATSWNGGHYRGSNFNRIDGFLIDEVDSVLSNIFGKPIVKATYTPEKIGVAKAYDKKVVLDDFEKRLDNYERVIERLGKRLVKLSERHEKKEEKMSKFKVGDIVRLKPVDEMWKSNRMLYFMEEFAETYHRIINVDIFTDETLYALKDCNCYYFDESMLEDRVYTEDDIFDINVIVPDKVVEIKFYEGKEKMVCHEDDVFDLRKCCFIAIAKHLYKKEYTQEGIEYMATQLTYQKKYVKIVDKALKDYKRKEEEKAEKIRREEEEKIIRARQSAKRCDKKERRAQKKETERNDALKAERAEVVSIIADAINKAKADRKLANKFKSKP